MREIRDEIEIDGPPERVWSVLMDFDAYPEWNPFVKRISGRAEKGAKLDVRIVPPGKKGMRFKPTVIAAEPRREFAWLGKVLVPGLFDGEHHFELEDLGGGRTRFVQREVFKGLLTPMLGGMLDNTHEGFRELNQALKRRVESSQTPAT
ncbi:MAG: SRPBCC family protein [Gaiellaceae bacterium]